METKNITTVVALSVAALCGAADTGIATDVGLARFDSAACGPITLRMEDMRLSFGDAASGFACSGLSSAGMSTSFFRDDGNGCGLWKLVFREGVNGTNIVYEARGAKGGQCERTVNGLRLSWKGLSVGGDENSVDVVCDVEKGDEEREFRFLMTVENRSKRYGLFAVNYPCLGEVMPLGTGTVLAPGGNWGGRLIEGGWAGQSRVYPSSRAPVQFMAFNSVSNGLYFAAHDGEARKKEFLIGKDGCVSINRMVEDAGVPGAGMKKDFPVVVSTYRGDWWAAARKYRRWALRQIWASKGPIAQRKDYPQRLRENCLWFQVGIDCDDVNVNESRILSMLDRINGRFPIGIHWYCWHKIPFDHSYPEYFPAKSGFGESVRRLQSKGVLVMPYVNGRLWDSEIPSYAAKGWTASCKGTDGKPCIEIYKSKRKLAAMCPETRLWQTTVTDLFQKLTDGCGVGGVYFDQIGAARPRLCFDVSHGHPLGGGKYWVDAYRKLLTPIKRQACKRGLVLTTENDAEPYMDNIDGFLIWGACHGNDRPVMTAVYSGYATYFGSPELPAHDLAVFRGYQLRNFIWGCQLGWFGHWICDEAHHEHFDYLCQLAEIRFRNLDFFADGQFVGEVESKLQNPLFKVKWYGPKGPEERIPTIQTAVWKTQDGRYLLIIANCGLEPCDYDGGSSWMEKPIRLNPGEVRLVYKGEHGIP